MANTLYLHVGPHKTGSTYLQTSFFTQVNALKTQGILYPAAGREFAQAHHNIAWLLSGRPLIKTTPDELSKKLALLSDSTEDILLSSEEFARIPEDRIPELKRAFPKHNFHLLYFQRDGIGLIVSLWQEMVKLGSDIPMNEITLSEMARFFNYNPFAHEETISKFTKHLGETVTVFDYNQVVAEKKDLLKVISQTLGVELSTDDRPVNPSLPIETIELIRAANIYNLEAGKPRRSIPRRLCLAMLATRHGTMLKEYVNAKFQDHSMKLNGGHFLTQGFEQASPDGRDLAKEYAYLPKRVLLDALNQDNIKPWNLLKRQIDANFPEVSICIVTLNARPYLYDCIKSIKEHTYRLSYEIIVVDNHSTDGTAAMLAHEFPEVVLIQNTENAGFSKANNQAIQAAKSENYILLLNPDTLVPKDGLKKLLGFADAHPLAGVVGPKVLNGDGSFQKHCKRGEGRPWETFAYFLKLSALFPKIRRFSGYLQSHLDENQAHEVPAVSGCCMLIRRQTIDEVGVLDEDLFAYQEDTEYCVRTRKAGWKVFYTSTAQITHFGGKGGSRVQPYKAIYEWHRSYYIYYKKHLAKDYFFLFNWFYYAVMLAKFCFTILVNLFRREKHAGPNRSKYKKS